MKRKVLPGVLGVAVGFTSILIFVRHAESHLTNEQLTDELREILLNILIPEETQELLASYKAVSLAKILGKESSREAILETIQKLLWDARKGRTVYGFFSEYGFSHEQISQLKHDRGLERLWELVKGGLNAQQLQGLYILAMTPLSKTM